MNVSIYLLKKTCIISKNLIVTYKIFEKCNYIQWKFIIICINLQEKLLKLSLDVKFIREYLTLHDQFNLKISNNMNVSIYLLKKTYIISKNYNKINENLQDTYKIFEKNVPSFNRNYNN